MPFTCFTPTLPLCFNSDCSINLGKHVAVDKLQERRRSKKTWNTLFFFFSLKSLTVSCI
ncbi:unnamed protein product [Brassica oleracea var. botrytis]